ncbi:RHS repeat-associated core domain-containing protein [Xenorhabdus bharatensis]|uniref:RHS repeat-associated core domain-containing protein n=1 Tax=Xenorhabdus bharatensis TaxID=3136256 RepID=UPI0030F3B3C1
MSTSLFSKTPMVTVRDNRGQTVREIAYHRHPDTPTVIDTRITHHHYDARGALTQSADPRLNDAGQVNFTYLTDLTGNVLRTQSADAGISVTLNDAAGRPFLAVTGIETNKEGRDDKSRAITRSWLYEGSALPGRLLGITEQVSSKEIQFTERFVYADNSQDKKNLNLVGQCISHYDTAGLVQINSIALCGAPLSVSRRLRQDADKAETVVNWQGENASVWDALLEEKFHETLTTVDATGAELTTTDAAGNRQRVAYDVAGLLKGSWLTLKKKKGPAKEQVIVTSLTYSAAGQKLSEEHGNGVVTTYTYEPETQRLIGIRTERPAGHTVGAMVLQDLRYTYDPVGNVLSIKNDAEATRYWRNQEVVPENTYTYDSLYQLVSATGCEMAGTAAQGKKRPDSIPLVSDNAYTNYTRHYHYDRGGNLIQICHCAPANNNCYTTNFTVSNRSNRSVLSTLTKEISEVDALFDGSGHQKQMQPGQHLMWTLRGELQKVMLVTRESGENDSENYRYDAGSQRVLKVSTQQTGNITQKQRMIYLPGLELRTKTNGKTEKEKLHVITVRNAGRSQVRVLHWENGKPPEININDQVRYNYDNLIGSSGLEVDGSGNVISQEEYYPYGGTAVWATRNQTEADYKTRRYSGKERDATGLYYYGHRYYQPWAGRWLSADPAGKVDGLNLFRMVRNNPIGLSDPTGCNSINHSELPANTKLSQIAMLGSHDAGTYAYSRARNGASSLGALFTRAFKTQNLSLKKQAEAGARYFDIRVAQNKNGSFSFFHGPSIAGGNATSDIRELLDYAADDKNNFYLMKFVFKGKKKAVSDMFLGGVIKNYDDHLINHEDTRSLANATVDLLSQGKNIGIMVHGNARTESELWSYKEQVHTKWANRANVNGTVQFLSQFHADPAPENKLNVIQTNIPVASPARKQLTLGVKSYLSRVKNTLANGINRLPHAGIISADYIGSKRSATEGFMRTIERHNHNLMTQHA